MDSILHSLNDKNSFDIIQKTYEQLHKKNIMLLMN